MALLKIDSIDMEIRKRATTLVSGLTTDLQGHIKLNQYFDALCENYEKSDGFSYQYPFVEEDTQRLNADSFDWRYSGHQEDRRSVGKMFSDLHSTRGLTIIDVRIFKFIFPLWKIKKYIFCSLNNLNLKDFENGLEFVSMLTSGLRKFYIEYDLRYLTKIHTRDAQSLDAFYRQRLRNRVLRSEKIQDTYLRAKGGANIKQLLVYMIREIVFLISNTRICDGFDIVGKIFQTIAISLEYGFWSVAEAIELVEEVHIAIPALIRIEEIISEMRDTFTPQELDDVLECLRMTRKSICVIIIQSIFLINDNCLISKFDVEREVYSFESMKSGEKLFFEEPFFMKYISTIALNYLLRDNNFLDKKLLKKSDKDYLKVLCNLMFHVKRDPYLLSIEYIDFVDIMNYNNNDVEIQSQLDTLQIRIEELKSLIDGLMIGEYGSSNFGMNDQLKKRLGTILDGILHMIEHKDDPDTIKLNLVLSESKVALMLVTLIDLLSGDPILKPIFTKATQIIGIIGRELDHVHVEVFSEECWFHLISYCERDPLNFSYLMEALSMDSWKLFHISPRFFFLIYEIFQKQLTRYEEDWSFECHPNITLEGIRGLFILSNTLLRIIEEIPESCERQPFDLVVATRLLNVISEIILPLLKKLSKSDIAKMRLNIDPEDDEISFIAPLKCNLTDIYESSYKEESLFLIWSLLRLFNSSIQDVYTMRLFINLRKSIWYETLYEYNHLTESIQGLLFRREIIKCANSLLIFHFNHVISDRRIHSNYASYKDLKDKGMKTTNTSLRDHELPDNYYSGDPVKLIASEFSILPKLYKTADSITNEPFKGVIGGYLVDGLFTMISKYVKGIGYICYDENIISQFHNQVKEIRSLLNSNFKLIERLTVLTHSLADKDQSDRSLLLESVRSLIPHSRNDNTSPVPEITTGSLKKEEKKVDIHQDDFSLRMRNIMKKSSQHRQEFKQEIKFLVEEVDNILEKLRFTVIIFSRGDSSMYTDRRDFIEEKVEEEALKQFEKHSQLRLQYDTVQLIRKIYSLKKTEFLDDKDNPIFKTLGFAGERSTDYLRLISYLCKDFDSMVVGIDASLYSKSFWIFREYITRIEILDRLISNSTSAKHFFYQEAIKKNGIIDKIFYVFIQLMLFTVHKTFHCKRWLEYKRWFLVLREFIQNLNEDNYEPFKEYFGSKVPFLRDQDFNIERGTYLTLYYNQIESILNLSKIWTNKSNWIEDSDRPETFDIIACLMNGLNEFITGPCKHNQRALFSSKKIEKLLKIAYRDVRITESGFYKIVEQIINHITTYTEGADKKMLKKLAKHIPPSKLFNRMIGLMKLLYQTLKEKNKQSAFGESHYVTHSMQYRKGSTNLLINKMFNSIVAKKEIRSLASLRNLYQTNNTFATHRYLKIAAKLYFFIKIVSTRSEAYQQFLIEKHVKMENPGLTEESIILEFLDEITTSVEIVTKSGEHIESNFIKMPQSFFLTNSTKDNFYSSVDIESTHTMLDGFMDQYKMFKIEMESSHKFNRNSQIFYRISNKDFFKIYVWVIFILGFVQNILIITFFKVRSKHSRFEETATYIIDAFSLLVSILCIVLLVFWLCTKYVSYRNIAIEEWRLRYGSLPTSIVQKAILYVYSSFFSERRISSLVLHLLFAILGYYNPFFITLHLLLVLNLSSTMRNVLSSILIHLDQLLQTFAFALIVIYCFAMLAAEYYADSFDEGAVGGQDICHNLFSCFMQITDLGLRFGGGIAEALVIVSTENPDFLGRWFYNIMFFVFINVIFLNVIFGIIIDTFAELRDKQSERDFAKRNKCYVCGLERGVFEHNGKNFDHHKNKEHSLWKYLYYLYYLDMKPVREYDGNEIYIWRCFTSGNIAWIPQGHTLFNGSLLFIITYRKT